VHDLLGIRAIVFPREGEGRSAESAEADAAEACYVVQRATHALWRPLPDRTKDYISTPKPNGYQSLHSTVTVRTEEERKLLEGYDEEQSIELQVRTAAMDQAAEQGVAAHAAYKVRRSFFSPRIVSSIHLTLSLHTHTHLSDCLRQESALFPIQYPLFSLSNVCVIA
jgi:(p)ppGpp synthase/HD superfamily hydrolase